MSNCRARPAGVPHVYAKIIRTDHIVPLNGSNVEMISVSNEINALNSTKDVIGVGGGAYNVSTS